MYLKINRILVPTDFTDRSSYALDYAALIAGTVKADIYLLYVAETHDKANPGEINEELRRYVDSKATREKDRLAKEGLDSTVRIYTSLVRGHLNEQVHKTVEELKIDLLVMGSAGSRGISRLDKYLLGNTASKTVHNARCMVLTVKNPIRKNGFRELLLPLDLTKETGHKVDLAITLSRLFGSNINLLAVTHYFEQFGSRVRELRALLEKVEQLFKDQNIRVSTEMIQHDDVVDSVIRYAEEVDADVVLIATRQENPIKSLILGSRARKIIMESPVPVISFRPY